MDALVLFHVTISLVGIGSGCVVVAGMWRNRPLDGWTAVFLATTVATSATGFLLPFERLLPSHVLGVISLVVLALALAARYVKHLAGHWRLVFVATALVAQYLNVLVLIVQAFLKVPALHALAPTQSESPFLLAQLVNLVAFVAIGIVCAMRFRTAATSEI